MNVLITGGSGFIGGYVYRYLKMNKYHVKNFDIIGNDIRSDDYGMYIINCLG